MYMDAPNEHWEGNKESQVRRLNLDVACEHFRVQVVGVRVQPQGQHPLLRLPSQISQSNVLSFIITVDASLASPKPVTRPLEMVI